MKEYKENNTKYYYHLHFIKIFESRKFKTDVKNYKSQLVLL